MACVAKEHLGTNPFIIYNHIVYLCIYVRYIYKTYLYHLSHKKLPNNPTHQNPMFFLKITASTPKKRVFFFRLFVPARFGPPQSRRRSWSLYFKSKTIAAAEASKIFLCPGLSSTRRAFQTRGWAGPEFPFKKVAVLKGSLKGNQDSH